MTFVISVSFVLVLLLASMVSSSSNRSTSVEVLSVSPTSIHGASFQHKRLMMIGSDTSFQIQSWQRSDICMEVFKTLDKVGRIWLQTCKSKSDIGIERQMFSVSNDGKLHPSTKPSSCIFLYKNKKLKYRINCASALDKDKNQFIYDFFDHTIFLMGDVTKVLTVGKSQEKKEVKLQKLLSITNLTQRWNLHFQIDRVLHYFGDDDDNIQACDKTPPPIPSSKYPPFPSVPTLTTFPPSTSRPTNPPTLWYHVSSWHKKSYIYKVWDIARRVNKDWEKYIVSKYG